MRSHLTIFSFVRFYIRKLTQKIIIYKKVIILRRCATVSLLISKRSKQYFMIILQCYQIIIKLCSLIKYVSCFQILSALQNILIFCLLFFSNCKFLSTFCYKKKKQETAKVNCSFTECFIKRVDIPLYTLSAIFDLLCF